MPFTFNVANMFDRIKNALADLNYLNIFYWPKNYKSCQKVVMNIGMYIHIT